LYKFSKPWYIKKKFYLEKNFSSVSAQPRPTHFFLSNRLLHLSPLGLGLSAGPSRPLGPADRAPVAPCRIAASSRAAFALFTPG
jgi:hypothetical protein